MSVEQANYSKNESSEDAVHDEDDSLESKKDEDLFYVDVPDPVAGPPVPDPDTEISGDADPFEDDDPFMDDEPEQGEYEDIDVQNHDELHRSFDNV
ncbi:hypothetical protein AAVH_02694 [Aphelenchoides avenae]|nr:hypothetical protein AAVH_02694 [Aphelenchus avenae]